MGYKNNTKLYKKFTKIKIAKLNCYNWVLKINSYSNYIKKKLLT